MKPLAIAIMVVALFGPAAVALGVVGPYGNVGPLWMLVGLAVTFAGCYAAASLWRVEPIDVAEKRIIELYLHKLEIEVQQATLAGSSGAQSASAMRLGVDPRTKH